MNSTTNCYCTTQCSDTYIHSHAATTLLQCLGKTSWQNYAMINYSGQRARNSVVCCFLGRYIPIHSSGSLFGFMLENCFFWGNLISSSSHARSQQIHWVALIFRQSIGDHPIGWDPANIGLHATATLSDYYHINRGTLVFNRCWTRWRN